MNVWNGKHGWALSVFFALFFLFGTIQANAENSVYVQTHYFLDDSATGWAGSVTEKYKNITIPDTCHNPFIWAVKASNASNGQDYHFEIDNVEVPFTSSTTVCAYPVPPNGTERCLHGYYKSIAYGEHKIEFNRSPDVGWSGDVIIFCNVDPENPFDGDFFLGDDNKYVDIGDLYYSQFYTYTGDLYSQPETIIQARYYSGVQYGSSYKISTDDTTPFNMGWSRNTYWTGLFNFILNYKEPVAVPEISILAFGYPNIWSNPSIFPYNSTKTYPIFYDLCEIYNDINRAVIQPVYSDNIYQPGYDVILDKTSYIGPQKCKGNYILKDNRASLDNGTVYFNLVAFDLNNNIVASTTSNTITFEEEQLPSTFIDHTYDKTVNIDIGNLEINPDYTASRTRMYFNYDFSEVNYASTTVILWDITQATSTGYSTIGPFSSTSTGVSYIDIPTPTEKLYKNYYFIAQIPGYKTIKSDMLSINWDFWPIEVYYDCEEVVVDMAEICEGIPETTIGDWICEGKTAIYKVINWAFYPKCKDLIALTVAFDQFKKGFPFNIYFDLTDTINNSIETATATATSTNNISIPFIRKTATSSEYYMLPVAVSSSVSNLIGKSNYNIYLTSLGFFYWLVCAVMIYFTIRK